MKSGVLTYKGLGNVIREGEKNKDGKAIFNKSNLILLPTAFLLGRVSIIGSIMPFGMSIYASTAGLEISRILIALFAIVGMISTGSVEQVYITSIAMILFGVISIPFKKTKMKENVKFAVISFVSILIPEMVMVYLQGFLLYDLLKAILDGLIVFSLVFVVRNVLPTLTSTKKAYRYKNEEIISIVVIAALCLAGLGDIELFGFMLNDIFSVILVLIFGYKFGAGMGSAIGGVVGLVLCSSTAFNPLIVGIYAISGMLCGVFKKVGKVGSSLGFVVGVVFLSMYLKVSAEVLMYFKDTVLAVVMFLLIPQKVIESFLDRFNIDIDPYPDKRSYNLRIKEITVERLNKFSRAFKELSRTFSEISETKVVTEKRDISAMFDRVADRVCKDCGLCLHCWDRNFYSTYQVMFKIVERLDEKGRIEQNDIPDYFMDRCERVYDFVDAVNNVFEVFKVDMMWKSKLGESRGLVSQQLEGLSKVISDLAFEIDMDIHFKEGLEELILVELNKMGVKTNEVIVFENKWGKYEISIFHKGCGGKRECIKSIEKMVSDIVGRKMLKVENDCYLDSKGNSCSLKLYEEEVYSVITGVAKAAKNNDRVSGDNYTFMNSGDGKYIVALSDGMGAGQRASTQSKATVDMLEQFIEAGFDKDTALKIINSILVLRTSDDSFTTIDMSLVDLFEGEVEFVKVGAAPTYIKRREKVEIIKSASLPAGILSNIELELVHKKLDSGDFVLMMTDGITDSFKADDENEKTLQDFIMDINSTNPQEIADIILNKASENCGNKPADDMMVVVSKVWKRVD